MASLKEGEQSWYGGGQFREDVHVMVVASLMEGDWSCYRGGMFNGGRMVMLQRWTV